MQQRQGASDRRCHQLGSAVPNPPLLTLFCSEADSASQLFYVRPRYGEAIWDAERAHKLKYMLESAVQRRFPKGLKIHVQVRGPPALHNVPVATQAKPRSLGVCLLRGRCLSNSVAVARPQRCCLAPLPLTFTVCARAPRAGVGPGRAAGPVQAAEHGGLLGHARRGGNIHT